MTTAEGSKVLAPAGAESEWISLRDVAARLFAASPAKDDPKEQAASERARTLILDGLQGWQARVRVLAFPQLRELEARHDAASDAAKADGNPATKAAAARELAEAELAILRAGLARVRHGDDGDGYEVDDARADDLARWSLSWVMVRAVVGYNSLTAEARAGFFTPGPAL